MNIMKNEYISRLEKENILFMKSLNKIVKILEESNVYPSTDCRLFLEDGIKIVKEIEHLKEKIKNNRSN